MAGNILLCTTGKPVKRKHICWNYWEGHDSNKPFIVLEEIVENYYPHPEAPEHALIQQIEREEVVRFDQLTIKAAPVLLLKHANDNCSTIFDDVVAKIRGWEKGIVAAANANREILKSEIINMKEQS
jgi:hypothetical protein